MSHPNPGARQPTRRRLRVYAFDPSLSTRMDTAPINEATITLPWEEGLRPGPTGEYVEVIDVDPASRRAYPPVDLNDPFLLAQDGLAPSEGSPRFHQQMVFCVAMRTIRNFEQALGRKALWSGHSAGDAAPPRTDGSLTPPPIDEEFVQRLRIYPHALREANAYYSPDRKALLFGYFPATSVASGQHFPGGLVFTCLSHDVIAHETSHALLDGMHRRFIERSNEDSLAFHEAFADIVALFQHFTMPEVLEHQIARTRGDLESQNLLGQLAQEFGQATGGRAALRDALGHTDERGIWHPREPNPGDLARADEPHARGALLVAAVFAAFLAIYRSRVTDLLRIATGGTGILPLGAISVDLVKRLSAEAAKSAQMVLTMCIRALDYLPPVDATFGDYLRALITADYDLVPDDPRRYRVAFIESFRRFGIYPRDVRTLSDDTLRWRSPEELGFLNDSVLNFRDRLKERLTAFANEWRLTGGKAESSDAASDAGPAGRASSVERPNRSGTYREAVFLRAAGMRGQLHEWIEREKVENETLRRLLGLDLSIRDPSGGVLFEVHSVRPTRRIGPDGSLLLNMVIEVTQRKAAWFDGHETTPEEWRAIHAREKSPDFWFRGGSTLIVDLETSEIRYVIRKDIGGDARLRRQRDYLSGKSMERFGRADAEAALRRTYVGRAGTGFGAAEPFALLHRAAPREGRGFREARPPEPGKPDRKQDETAPAAPRGGQR